MAKDFDGVDDIVACTIPNTLNNSAWTFGAWINPDTIGETGARIFSVWNGSIETHEFRLFDNTNRQLAGSVANTGGTIFPTTSTNPVWTTGTWSCVFFTYDGAGAAGTDVGFYAGSLSAAVASKGTGGASSGVTGSAPLATGGTTLHIGNRNATDRTFDGRIARPFLVPWQMTVDEMNLYRGGDLSALFLHGSPVVFLPFTSPSDSVAADLSGNGRNGTVTGAVAAEDPPVPFILPG